MFLTRPITILLTGFLLSGSVVAGTGTELSLKEALDAATKSNLDIRLAESEKNAMQADLNKTLSLFLPQVSISETAVLTNDPLNVFGIKLKQEVVSAADFDPGLLNDPKTITNYTTKIEIRQPLINADGWSGRSSAAHAVEALKSKMQRTSYYVAFQVKLSYYRLALARQSLQVLDKSLEAAYANRDQAKKYFEQGMIRKSDFLFAQVRTLELENRRLETINQINDASNDLSVLIGMEPGTELVPTDTLSTILPAFPEADIDQINQNRSDMRAYRSQIRANQRVLGMQRFKFAPSLNAFAAYELNDKAAFGGSGKNWMIGAMLKWDLFTGFDQVAGLQKAKATLTTARLQMEKAAIQNRSDILSAYRALETSRKAVALTKISVEQSEENYRIVSDRYTQGLEKISDLLNAEATLSNARLQHLQSLFGFHSRFFALELMTESKL